MKQTILMKRTTLNRKVFLKRSMIMLRRTSSLTAMILLLVIPDLSAQEEEPSFGIRFKGFVKNDFFWDSRQVTAAREGHYLLWPDPVSPDVNGNDINAKPNFNFLAVQTRLTGVITGPDAFGAKTSGLIEVDFFAQLNQNINLMRMRHALVKFNWERTEVLAGQFWNPFFVTACYPGTISFNTGTPIQSFARNPQFRISHKIGPVTLIAAALAQRDFASRGPDPADNTKTAVTSDFLRNALVPDAHFQVHFNRSGESSGNSFLAGAGMAYKTIVPRLKSVVGTDTYVVDEKVSGLSALLFTKIKVDPFTLKLQGRYGENIPDMLAISGFAVRAVTDPGTGEQSYTPLRNIGGWGDLHTNGEKLQVGIFGGYTRNLGTRETMSAADNPVYGLATNIESLFRISPRILYASGKAKIGAEVEITAANYGSGFDERHMASSVEQAVNTRLLLSVLYAF